MYLLHGHLDGRAPVLGKRELDLLGLARRHTGQRGLDIVEEPTLAQLDHVIALNADLLADQVEDDDVARLHRAVGGSELGGRRADSLELRVDVLFGDLGLGSSDLERRPVGKLGRRHDRDGRGEAKAASLCGGIVVQLHLRARHRPDARRRGGRPEPTVEMAPHRFLPERVAPHASGNDPDRDLALAEAGDAHLGGEVRCRVLERVPDVLLRNLDLESNAALGELFDLRLHCEPFCQ